MNSILRDAQNKREQAIRTGRILATDLANMEHPIAKELASAITTLINSNGEADGINLKVTELKAQFLSTLPHTQKMRFNQTMGKQINQLQDAVGYKS